MGAVRAIYLEDVHEFRKIVGMLDLNLSGTRKYQATKLRYCLQDNVLHIPADADAVEQHKACWARIHSAVIYDLPFEFEFNNKIPSQYGVHALEGFGIGLGTRYSKRHKEDNGKRIAVSALCSQTLIDSIAENPEVLETIAKDNFEALCSELFARRGFEVDLFRTSKDDGIDFLAVHSDGLDPIIMCVQCKHPDNYTKSLPVSTVREIYGVAKANDYNKCLVITSTKYSREAKKFMQLKPEEISLADREDILNWVTKYRWNKDE